MKEVPKDIRTPICERCPYRRMEWLRGGAKFALIRAAAIVQDMSLSPRDAALVWFESDEAAAVREQISFRTVRGIFASRRDT